MFQYAAVLRFILQYGITGCPAFARHDSVGRRYFFTVTRPKKSTSALRSTAEPMVCSGILVPGV
jgi:hypothetical protein